MERVLVRRAQGEAIFLMDPSLFKLHRYLFILSHARSYSTLLCHILGSHRQISGYVETRMPYETAVDLYRLNAKACEAGNYRNDCEYVLDKLIYDDLTISDQGAQYSPDHPDLSDPGARANDREPDAHAGQGARARDSDLGRGNRSPRGCRSRRGVLHESARNLANSLPRLESLGGRGIVLSARCLLDDTAGTLRFLEGALKLDGPLRPEYRVFEKTGTTDYGDTSTMIRTGRVVRDPSEREDVPSPPNSSATPGMLTLPA